MTQKLSKHKGSETEISKKKLLIIFKDNQRTENVCEL